MTGGNARWSFGGRTDGDDRNQAKSDSSDSRFHPESFLHPKSNDRQAKSSESKNKKKMKSKKSNFVSSDLHARSSSALDLFLALTPRQSAFNSCPPHPLRPIVRRMDWYYV